MSFSRIPQFYKMSVAQRKQEIISRTGLCVGDLDSFTLESGLSLEQASAMIENVIGIFGLPVGVVPNFVVDGEPVLVPMAIEEPSIVAASSHIAKLAASSGGFHTEVDDAIMIGQIQIIDVLDVEAACEQINSAKIKLLDIANSFCANLQKRGGGCVDIVPRMLPPLPGEPADAKPMLVVHLLVNCVDAMGANIVNTVAEGLAPEILSRVGGELGFRILSNLADKRMAKASCRIPYRLLTQHAEKEEGQEVAKKIVNGYVLARRDPYRAATHNKGIMNGIDAVAIATGNDWRAIEAGAHAYAATTGSYTSLTDYKANDETQMLECSIALPLAVGVVGGNTQIHPNVNASLKLLGSFGLSAKKLAGLMACVGLAQNLAALRALACEGIQKGHMALHCRKNTGG